MPAAGDRKKTELFRLRQERQFDILLLTQIQVLNRSERHGDRNQHEAHGGQRQVKPRRRTGRGSRLELRLDSGLRFRSRFDLFDGGDLNLFFGCGFASLPAAAALVPAAAAFALPADFSR